MTSPVIFGAGIGPFPVDARENALMDEPAVIEREGVLFIAMRVDHRLAIATTIEHLITMLDETEPDPDLEPSLGWCGDCHGARLWGTADDREEVNEDGSDYDLNGHADHGIADRDALDSEEFCFGGFRFDGSGRRQALRMLDKAGL